MKFLHRLKLLTSLLILIALLVILPAIAALANNDVVYIHPFRTNEVHVNVGQTMVINWGWLNCARGLSYAWENATVQHYRLINSGGDVIYEVSNDEIKNDWGNPYPSNTLVDICFLPAKETWVIRWMHELPTLGPGVYTLESKIDTTHKLTDGFDLIEEFGELDFYTPRNWVDRSITIFVD